MAAVGDLVRLRLFLVELGQKLEMGFGFRCLVNGATFADLASDFKTSLVKNTAGGILSGMQDDISSSQLRIEDVKPGASASYDYAYTAVPGNTAVGEPLPPQCAMVVSWRTAFAGRSYHGRTYTPGYGETDQSGGTWTAGAIANCQAWVDALLARYGPAQANPNWEFGVISTQANGAPRATPIETQILGGIVRPTVYTQRRRTLGVGS